MEIKTIGVLTSGGDAPGMNAAVRAVVRSGISQGLKVIGINRGYAGLIAGDVKEMTASTVSDTVHRGGTILYTARCKEFREEAGLQKAKDMCKKLGIDGIAVIGGDGSYRGARDLSVRGVPCIGIPGTIDNDIACTDYTIGYDTAMNTALDMIDRLMDTAMSHERCIVVEVMGRGAGYIALNTAIAAGASAVLIPEVEPNVEAIITRLQRAYSLGKKHSIVVVAEGSKVRAQELTEIISNRLNMEARCMVLGHVQRGGSPTLRDRVEASRMGCRAVELLSQGIGNRVVCCKGNEIVDYDILEALQMKKEIDMHLYKVMLDVSF